MPCFNPFYGNIRDGVGSLSTIPMSCGHCPYCRYQNRRIWSFRIEAERIFWEKSCFITLTYDPAKYPRNTLSRSHLQGFYKRLRRRLGDLKIKHFSVGEYSIQPGNNPHYHAIIFGLAPESLPIIESAWKWGFVHAGTTTEKSVKYVAGYVLKKIGKTSDREKKYGVLPEFMQCSRGIGLKFIEDFPMFVKQVRFNGKTQYLGRYLINKLKYKFYPYDDLETRRNPMSQIMIEDMLLNLHDMKERHKFAYDEVYKDDNDIFVKVNGKESLLTFAYKNDNIQRFRDFLSNFKSLKRLQNEKIEIQSYSSG